MFEREALKLYSKLDEQEIDGQLRYFKKREVYPPFTREGKIIWKNFLIGNWKNFLIVVFIVLVTLGIIYEYTSNIKIGAECIARENALKFTNLIK